MSFRILLAADGSSIARSAARYAIQRFALPNEQCQVDVLHVHYRVPSRAAAALGREIVQSYYREETQQALKPVQAALDAKVVPYRSFGKIGNPADQIARHAEEAQTDLIVMGSHGLGGAKGLLLGSVAQAVITQSSVPVLIVREGSTKTWDGGVLVAVDGSEFTRRALAYLVDHGDLLARGSEVTLLHVTAPDNKFSIRLKASDAREMQDAEFERALAPARRLLTRARMPWREVQGRGEPGSQIAEHARTDGSGLIVMGSHGRGAMTGLLLGSVAQKTLSACQTPVLIVR
jgi:nucleotide-binding universal stress UspA family protein